MSEKTTTVFEGLTKSDIEKGFHKVWKCPQCGLKLHDGMDYLNHIRAQCLIKMNAVVKETGEVQCSQCKTMFHDWEKYSDHWKYNTTNCSDHAWQQFRFRPQKKDDEEWQCDPIWEAMIKRRIHDKREYWRLRYKINATGIFIRKIRYGFENESWNIVLICGPTGIGKSRLGLVVSKFMKNMLIELGIADDPDIHFARHHNDVRWLLNESEKHDIILCDEFIITSGADSDTNLNAFLNLMDTARYSEVNLVVCTPMPPKELRSVQVVLEMVYKNKKKRLSKFIVYDPEQVPLGWGKAHILSNSNSLEKRYKKFKHKMVAEIKKSGGLILGTVSPEQVAQDTHLLVALLKNEYDDIDDINKKRAEDMASLYIRGSTRYQTQIADKALYEIKKEERDDEEKGEPITVEPKGLAEEWLPPIKQERTVRNDQIYDLVYKYSKPLNREERLGKEYWYNYYAKGMGQEEASTAACETLGKIGINPKTGKMYTRQSFVIKKGFRSAFLFAPNCLGQGVERAINELYFKDYVHHGATGEPDLIGPDGDVVEVKGRTMEKDAYKRLSKNLRQAVDDEKYMRQLVADEVPITIIGVDIGQKDQGCWVTVGKVKYD